MKNTILKFGAISGAIVAGVMLIAMVLNKDNPKIYFEYGMVIGYSSMLLAFSLIFVAIKNYRDKHLDGMISFGKAFLIGLGIAVIASVFYTVTWVIIYKNVYPTFMEDYGAYALEKMRAANKSAAEISKLQSDIAMGKQLYSTWPGLLDITFMEIFWLGLVISVISALILKRKNKTA